MKFLSTTAKLAGALGTALLLSTAIANAAPANTHDMGAKIERHDTRGVPAKPQFEGRKFARTERHAMTHRCDKAHRNAWHERHAFKDRHDGHRMADAGKHHDRGPDRFDRHDHDRRS